MKNNEKEQFKKDKKKKDTCIKTNGVVVSVLGNSFFRVSCNNNEIIIARISSEFRKNKKKGSSSKIIEGSKVRVAISLNDLSKGNIIGFSS